MHAYLSAFHSMYVANSLALLCLTFCCTQVDIYSFGVVLWEIVTQDKGRRGHLRQTRPDECPAEIEGLIDKYAPLSLACPVHHKSDWTHGCWRQLAKDLRSQWVTH